MKPYPRKRYAPLILPMLVIAGTFVACALWIRSEQRRYALNRQLITALKQHNTTLALELVNAGADPNLPTKTGDTPLKLARSRHLSDLVALMQRTSQRVEASTSNGLRTYLP